MARKKADHPHENHERWLVSYADFITLLFAFFVVMFASSQSDKAKAQQMSEAVRDAFEKGHFASNVTAILGGSVDDRGKGNAQLRGPGGAQKAVETKQQMAELAPSLKILNEQLEKEIRDGKVQVTLQPRGLVVSLKEAAFFPSGEDSIMRGADRSLAAIASVVRALDNPVRLEGHTDSIPIHTARFHNNWELSAARAIAILSMFSQEHSVPEKRMAVTGYADTYPVAGNDTAEGRAKNRRVDVLVMSERAMISAPQTVPESTIVSPKKEQSAVKH
jgi:chemotaxis protein MotB